MSRPVFPEPSMNALGATIAKIFHEADAWGKPRLRQNLAAAGTCGAVVQRGRLMLPPLLL